MTVCAKYLGGKSLAAIVASTAFLTVMSGSAAFAQNCTGVTSGPFGNQLGGAAAAGGSAAGSFAGALGNLATAFTTQQGSAFVSAPGDPKPNQEGGGVWTRAVGGEVTNTFSSNSIGSVIGPPLPDSNAAVTCAGSVHETFAGLQVGTDISRLNVNGWNIHLGTMAGYLNSHATDNAGGTSDFDVPFFGAYLVATRGRFFADIGIREEYYSASLNNPTVGLFGQRVGARGTSITTSAGYNFALANNWFIEPSAGFIWSRTTVDPFFISGGLGGEGVVSSFQTNPIESEIGRLTVRVGTTVNAGAIIWQPFATASVFHEFAGNVTSTASSLPNGAFGTVGFCPICITVPVTLNGSNSTTRVGTYGQYSLGLAAQVANTGWLGFVRVDYRNGSNIEGWTGNAGLRYQFTPETLMAAIMPRKAPVKAVPYYGATNWGGFYAGGFLGVDYGNTRVNIAGDTGAGSNPKVAGALGGFELGYNWHLPNQFVLGVEGDIGSTNLHGAQSCGQDAGRDVNGVTVRFPSAYLNCQNASNWMATLAARLGYASGRTLYYVKAGGAYADDHVSVSCIFGPLNGTVTSAGNILGPCLNPALGGTNGFSTSGYRTGLLLGFGTEFDLGHNWSAKGEYNYIDFGSRTALSSDGLTVVRDSGVINQVKIGVNYRFAAQPIVARY